MTFGYIYKIVFTNGKHYIGLTTTSLKERRKQHNYCAKSGDTKCLYNALRKYNIVDTFELIEIDTADTLEELCEKEIGYIIEYNSYYMNKNGYNMTYGGEGTFGYVHTEEQRKEQSKISKLQWESQEAREQMSEIKKKYYEEHPEKGEIHGEIMKTYYEEHPEAREQMSEIKKKYYEEHPEAIQKRLDAMGKNKPFDVFKIDGTFIKTFTYQFEAKEYLQKEYNITSTFRIGEVLAGNRKNSAGFVFKYK